MDANKDGVTLIADAIRKEIADETKKEPTGGSNVSDITAQFTKPVTPEKGTDKTDTTKTETTNNTETNTDNQEDN